MKHLRKLFLVLILLVLLFFLSAKIYSLVLHNQQFQEYKSFEKNPVITPDMEIYFIKDSKNFKKKDLEDIFGQKLSFADSHLTLGEYCDKYHLNLDKILTQLNAYEENKK